MTDKEKSYQKARKEIYNWLFQFSMLKKYEDGGFANHGTPFLYSFDNKHVRVGDLVIMGAHRHINWKVCWILDRKPKTSMFDDEWLCQSVETGELCWWHNVSFMVYDREEVQLHPHWRWNDRQFEFNDRWLKVCRKHDAYIVLPTMAEFGDDYNVTLRTRIRYGRSDYSPTKMFEDYRKVTKKDMSEFYLECKENYDNQTNRTSPD